MADGVFSQAPDGIEDGRDIREEISSCRLLIDEETLLPNLHIDPVYRDIEAVRELGWTELARIMRPSGPAISHWNSGAASNARHGVWEHFAFIVGGTMTFAGQDGGDDFVGHTLTGEVEHPIAHFGPSRELRDGVDGQFDFKIAGGASAPDNSGQRDIVFAALKHDLIDQTTQ